MGYNLPKPILSPFPENKIRELSEIALWMQGGMQFKYNKNYSDRYNGYYKFALLTGEDGYIYQSQVDNNIVDPKDDKEGKYWRKFNLLEITDKLYEDLSDLSNNKIDKYNIKTLVAGDNIDDLDTGYYYPAEEYGLRVADGWPYDYCYGYGILEVYVKTINNYTICYQRYTPHRGKGTYLRGGYWHRCIYGKNDRDSVWNYMPSGEEISNNLNNVKSELELKIKQLDNSVTTLIKDGSGLGYNQTWKDVTSQRKSGVTYTNTTGKPIVIQTMGHSKSGGNGSDVRINSSSGFHIAGSNQNNSGWLPTHGTTIIPKDATFNITFRQGCPVSYYCYELS